MLDSKRKPTLQKACFSIFCESSLSVNWPAYERLWQQITLCSFALGRAPDNGTYAWQAQRVWASGTSGSISGHRSHLFWVLPVTYNN
jgi:hypothetical protein